MVHSVQLHPSGVVTYVFSILPLKITHVVPNGVVAFGPRNVCDFGEIEKFLKAMNEAISRLVVRIAES